MTSVSRDQKHRRGHPCPLCGGWEEQGRGKGERCSGYTSSDGEWVFCTREELAGKLDPYGNSSPPAYRHMMHGPCHCGVQHGEPQRSGRTEPEAVYPYRDAHGTLVYEVVRMPGKRFFQRRIGEHGGWINNLQGVQRVIYRLPELIAASTDRTMYIVEGEKDVHALERAGELATCNSGGAGKWKDHSLGPMALAVAGRNVVVVADADEVGRKHALAIAKDLETRGCASVITRECPAPHKDVHDLLAAGLSLVDLVPLGSRESPRPPPDPGPTPGDKSREKPIDSSRRPAHADPLIEVTHEIHAVVDAAERALVGAPVYVRAGALVRVTRDAPPPSGVRRAAGAAAIRVVSLATITETLTRHARWGKYDGRADKVVACKPPSEVTSALIERGEWPLLRPLVGILEAPALRVDGSIIQTPGYDVATGYLYIPSGAYDAVPESPTLADAERSRDALLEVVEDFPFAGPEHRAAWLAGLLTLFARPAIDGCVPMIAIDATTAGTGKGRMADAMAILATGRPAPRTVYSKEEEEFRKRLTALVVEGEPLMLLDNVQMQVKSSTLEALITSESWKDRRLGVTETITAPNTTTVLLTANNLQLAGDLARRALHVRLESQLERPDLRDDLHHPELLEWITAERHRLVPAALTWLRAHAFAGRPAAGLRPLGGFEAWTRVVASAVAWAGAGDPLAAREALVAASDTERATLVQMVLGLERLCPVGGLTCKEILSRLYTDGHGPATPDGYEDLRDAIEECSAGSAKGPNAKSLGRVLRSARGRVLVGRSIESLAGGNANALRWRVRTQAARPVEAPDVVDAPDDHGMNGATPGAFDDMM